MTNFLKRKTKDLAKLNALPNCSVYYTKEDTVDEFYVKWEINQDVPYYGGQIHWIHFKLRYGYDYNDASSSSEYINNYPIQAPLCTFKSPIWHPNIGSYTSGIICVDILKDDWAPSMNLCSIIKALELLLMSPNDNSPQNSEALSSDPNYPEIVKSYYKQYYRDLSTSNLYIKNN